MIAGKGVKQVGQVTSAERGILVTMVSCINALGNSISPFLIFPRVHLKVHKQVPKVMLILVDR